MTTIHFYPVSINSRAMTRLFDEINKKVFGGKLPACKLYLVDNLTNEERILSGAFLWKVRGKKEKHAIFINRQSYLSRKETMFHEVAHYTNRIIYNNSGDSHGQKFDEILREIEEKCNTMALSSSGQESGPSSQ